ncbi:MAG: heavy-metal-associated domain-containing protein [Chloroflexota bacterium]
METKTLNAPGINCGHCVMSVKRALGTLAGVSAVEADAGTKDVTVTYDPATVTLEDIKGAMAAAGYPAA